MTWIRREVIMLPTDDKTILCLEGNKLTLERCIAVGCQHKFQHLYILSDEKIEEGDWYYHPFLKRIVKASHVIDYREHRTKIIASTDESLRFNPNVPNFLLGNESLPQPSQEFIEAYVKAYNEGNSITEFMVEYEEYMTDGWVPTYNNPDNSNCESPAELDYKLKVKSDNTISIRKIKDSWSREEVTKFKNYVELILDYSRNTTSANVSHKMPAIMSKLKELLSKIEQNL